jgi:hypothetical protein
VQDGGELVAAGQGVGVFRPEQPGLGLHDDPVLGFGFRQPPPVAQDDGEVAATSYH